MKKSLLYSIVFLFLFVFLTPSVSSAYTFNQPLKPFSSSGEDVNQLQFILSKEGFFKGTVSGKYGALTVEAVRKYQAKYGLTPDGSVGPKTLAVLNGGQVLGVAVEGGAGCDKGATVSRELKYGEKGPDVATVQTQLDCFGFTDGPNDGYYGPQTAESVASFQKSRGLAVNGNLADVKTLLALNIVLRTENNPEIIFSRAPTTPSGTNPAPSLRAPGTTNVHFVDYHLTTNSAVAPFQINFFNIYIRQTNNLSTPAISNLRLLVNGVQAGQTIQTPLINTPVGFGNSNLFSCLILNTSGCNNIQMGPNETKTFSLYFDILPTAVGGTIIDTEDAPLVAWPQLWYPPMPTMGATPQQPLNASTVTIITPQSSGTITLNKTVSGGPNAGNPSAFTPIINGSSNGVAWGVPFTVSAGTHSISEGPVSGYTAGPWTGTGCTNTGSPGSGTATVTVSAGQNIICNITNTHQPPVPTTIRVTKSVIPNTSPYFGQSQSQHTTTFQPMLDGSPISFGQTYTVSPGTHTLSETPRPDHTPGWSPPCVSAGPSNPGQATFTITAGQQLTCTLFNVYAPAVPSTITLNKIVSGGPLAGNTNMQNTTAFAPRVNMSAVIFGNPITVPPGTHSIAEFPANNYVPGNWVGAGCTTTGSFGTGSVTITAGQNITCTITNTYNGPPLPGTITLRKTVVGGPQAGNNNIQNTVHFQPTVGTTAVTFGQASNFPPGTHIIQEAVMPGYTAGPWTGTGCTNTGNPGSGTATVTLASNQNITCSITNTYVPPLPATITLRKNVINGGPYASNQAIFAPMIGSTPVTWGQTLTVPTGMHTIRETPQANYTPGLWIGAGCANTGPGAGTVSLIAGENIVCTITNTYVPPPATIELRKTISGGTATLANFTPRIDGVDTTWNTRVVVTPGVTHLVSEIMNVPNYTAGQWGGACGNLNIGTGAGTFSVAPGENKICTITNTYKPPVATIELRKEIVGGTATLANFTPRVDGVNKTWNTKIVVTPGVTHFVTETMNVPHYTASQWGGDCGNLTVGTGAGVFSVAPGENKVCTIKNTIASATITLQKQIAESKSIGTASRTTSSVLDWELTASGGPTTTPPVSGRTGDPSITNRSVLPGTYTLSERGPSGYINGAWSCTRSNNTQVPVVNNRVALANGDVVICTVVNTPIPPASLQLVKNVVNCTKCATPPALTSEWTLRATGPTPLSGVGGVPATTVIPGRYRLSEVPTNPPGPANFTASNWNCTVSGGQATNGSWVDIAAGQSAICTITNTYTPACTVSLNANPLSIPRGTSSSLTWSTANCAYVYLNSSPVVPNMGAPGQSTGNLTSNRTYTLIGTNTAGCRTGACVRATAQVTVQVFPACTIDSFNVPSSVSISSSGAISVPTSWSTTNCNNVTVQAYASLAPAYPGTGPTQIGPTRTGPVDGSYTFSGTNISRTRTVDNTVDVLLVASNGNHSVSRVRTLPISNIATPRANQCAIPTATVVPSISNSSTISWSMPNGCSMRLGYWKHTTSGLVYTPINNPGSSSGLWDPAGSTTFPVPRPATVLFFAEFPQVGSLINQEGTVGVRMIDAL